MAHPIRALVPFVHVRSVPESIACAWLQSGIAQLMLAKAGEPVVSSQQAVLFYLYVEDVAAKHEELRAGGVPAGDINYPFFAPRGEFRVTDPDGYVLMITHT
ncbi:MAG TPA: VOC family protein [Thermoanaerobaculia bacterium]|nr:VOC family protein [Thermoanaerobaculia bacterium]